MKFKHLINEKYNDTFSVLQYSKKYTVEVFENPSKHETNNLLKNSKFKTLRGFIHKNKLYLWIGDVAHSFVGDKLDIATTDQIRVEYEFKTIKLWKFHGIKEKELKSFRKILKPSLGHVANKVYAEIDGEDKLIKL